MRKIRQATEVVGHAHQERMPVEPTSTVPAGRHYARPALIPLGTLADLTRGGGDLPSDDGLGDASGDVGSI